MAVIWGLDLREIQWSKFQSSYMFSRKYKWRPTKMAVYQVAMIAGIISDAIGQHGLTNYRKHQNHVQEAEPASYEYNNDYIGAASYNTFATTFIAIIFGSGYFFDLIWPERHESRAVRIAWTVTSILSCMFMLADALWFTVVVASHRTYITGVTPQRAAELEAMFPYPPPVYRHYARAVVSVVFCWICAVFTFVSAIVLIVANRYNDKYGARRQSYVDKEEAASEKKEGNDELPVAEEAEQRH